MTAERSYTREAADRFIREAREQVLPAYRLNYHLMPEAGWMNDPNGFIRWGGEYHLFYQHYPYEPSWGPMHWGHAVSRDLVKWTYLPVALAPDTAFDAGGCFSGSAIGHEGKLVLMYTGHVVTGPEAGDYKQSQGIAESKDGVTFEKWAGNPVIGYDEIPEGVSRKDFRDPKVFERDGAYYVVLGSNDTENNGLVLLYRSGDLKRWTYIDVLAKSDGRFGVNWECPDLFPLGGKDVFMLSPQLMPAQGEAFRNLHSTMAVVGRLALPEGTFAFESFAPVDQGFDFYAPQSTEDERGRRLVVGWMDMWDSDMPTRRGHGWAGAMSLPREAVLDGGRILYRPAEEIEAYRGELYETGGVNVVGELALPSGGDSYELLAEFNAGNAVEFGLKLRTDIAGTEETVVGYRPAEELLRLNRDRSGIGPGGERKAAVPLVDGRLTLRVFVDRSSVEVFAGDGEVVMTARIYPGAGSLGIRLYAEGGACQAVSVRKWDIEVLKQ